jgi:hypothetical protein
MQAKTTFVGIHVPRHFSKKMYENFLTGVVGYRAGIFKESMWARNRGGMAYRTGPPGYLGWRN